MREEMAAATTRHELFRVLELILWHMGIEHYAFMPSLWMREVVTNFPHEWRLIYLELGYFAFDPVPAMADGTSRPFMWAQAEKLCMDNFLRSRVMQNARDYGLISGCALPIPMTRGRKSLMSLSNTMSDHDMSCLLRARWSDLSILVGLFHARYMQLMERESGTIH